MMKQKEVFNKIGGIIKELNEQYQYLQTAPETLNDLELELFVANTHFLADHAEVLRKINKQSTAAKPVEEKPASYEEIHFEPVIRKADPEPEPEMIKHELEVDESWTDDEETTLDEEVIEDEGLVSEPIHVNEPEIMVGELPEPLIAEEPTAIKEPAKEVDEVFTINQKISAQMGSKPDMGLLPITDLKPAITLNDKLLFIKDLFNGYSLAYSEAIEILNRFKGFEEADTFLKKNYVVKNNWEAKPETTAKFYELLKRRYM
ncbi:MAG: hypothetical protein ABI367_00300 [Mucilaginibacter sp.]